MARVLAVVPDLMLSSRVAESLGAAGHEVTVVASLPEARRRRAARRRSRRADPEARCRARPAGPGLLLPRRGRDAAPGGGRRRRPGRAPLADGARASGVGRGAALSRLSDSADAEDGGLDRVDASRWHVPMNDRPRRSPSIALGAASRWRGGRRWHSLVALVGVLLEPNTLPPRDSVDFEVDEDLAGRGGGPVATVASSLAVTRSFSVVPWVQVPPLSGRGVGPDPTSAGPPVAVATTEAPPSRSAGSEGAVQHWSRRPNRRRVFDGAGAMCANRVRPILALPPHSWRAAWS